MVFNLASLGSVGPPTQAREEIFCFCFGNLGTLPLSELLAVNQCCQDGKNKAVTHVQNAHNLKDGTVGDETF